eukprot:3741379-Rhodomonas_salina.1
MFGHMGLKCVACGRAVCAWRAWRGFAGRTVGAASRVGACDGCSRAATRCRCSPLSSSSAFAFAFSFSLSLSFSSSSSFSFSFFSLSLLLVL